MILSHTSIHRVANMGCNLAYCDVPYNDDTIDSTHCWRWDFSDTCTTQTCPLPRRFILANRCDISTSTVSRTFQKWLNIKLGFLITLPKSEYVKTCHLQSGQNQAPWGSDFRPMHEKWNHSVTWGCHMLSCYSFRPCNNSKTQICP